jgi:hypothetical protein
VYYFIDNRVIPILLEPSPGREVIADGYRTLGGPGRPHLTKCKSDDRVAVWSMAAVDARPYLDSALAARIKRIPVPPQILEIRIEIYDNHFLNLRTRWSSMHKPQEVPADTFSAISESLHEKLIPSIIRQIFDAHKASHAETLGLEDIGFDGPCGNYSYCRRYNTYSFRSGATKEDYPGSTQIAYQGTQVFLAWQISGAQFPADVSLDDPQLISLLRADAFGLCYSSALHVSMLRAGNVLSKNREYSTRTHGTQNLRSAFTSKKVRCFIGELALLMTRAEFLQGWVGDDEKVFIDDYSRINNFSRRYQALMDLERSLGRLADVLAADEESRNSFYLRLVVAFVGIGAIGSAFNDVFQLFTSDKPSGVVLGTLALLFIAGGIAIAVYAYVRHKISR